MTKKTKADTKACQKEQQSAEEQPTVQTAAPDAQELPETITLTKAEVEQLREHIATLQKEKEQTVELAQRLQADFENYRRRNVSLRKESYEEGLRSCMKELLPVLDNFERAMQSAPEQDDGWCSGIALVHKQLMDTLQKQGLSEIPTDRMFNPNLHEAVMQEPSDTEQSGTILAVFQKGYQVNERIIRHSMVKVAQ